MTTLPEHPDANLRPASFQRTSRHGVYLCTLCPDLRTGCLSVVSLYVSPLFKKERLWQEPWRYPVSCTLQTLLLATTKMIVPQRSNLSGICLKTSLSSPTVEGVERRLGVTWATSQSQTNRRPMSWLPLRWGLSDPPSNTHCQLPPPILSPPLYVPSESFLVSSLNSSKKIIPEILFLCPLDKAQIFLPLWTERPLTFPNVLSPCSPTRVFPCQSSRLPLPYLLVKTFPGAYSVSVCTKWLCQNSSASTHCIHRASAMSLGSYSKGRQETNVFLLRVLVKRRKDGLERWLGESRCLLPSPDKLNLTHVLGRGGSTPACCSLSHACAMAGPHNKDKCNIEKNV